MQDDAFTEVLEGNWEKFSVLPGLPVPKSRKFDPAPQFRFDESSYHNPQFLPCYLAEKCEEANRSTSSNLPRIRKPEYASSTPLKLGFKFYGNSLSITYDKLLSLPVNQPANKELIADYWKRFLVGNSHHLIGQLMTIRDRLGLNDWGYFLLVKNCCNALYPNDEVGAVLLNWALMIRSGFDVKIGYNQLGVSVLFTTASKINGIPSVKINGTDYYIDQPIASFPISCYTQNHSGASGIIHLRFNQSLNFQGEVQYKKIQFPWDRKLFEFSLKYNPEVIRYLEEYPQTEPELYFDAPFSFLSGESIQRQFKPVLAAMRKEESVAFLQQFVQKSFAYRPYNDMYGFDRFMFPEELLFKEESNDKGKSLLFAWMISNLLNQNAALVEFPGFYSVAISMDQPMDGDNFLVNGKKYTIADPTFYNAPLGLIMKEFYPLKPAIRLLKNVSEETSRQDKIWNLALAFGAERSGTGKDFLSDENGNSYITGFFNDKSTNKSLSTPAPFIAKFDENNSLVWMRKFHAEGKSYGLELKQLDQNEFYLAGSFRGKLECNGKIIETNPSDPDLFMAQFNRQGEIQWLLKSGLDELEEDTKMFYVVRFTRSGDIQSVQVANEDERTGITGFQVSNKEGLCYIASRYQTTGLDKSDEESAVKSSILLKQNLNRMHQLGIEPCVASLASLFNSVLNPGSQLTGIELYTLNQEKTRQGISYLSNLTEIIQNIKSIKNTGGIISIETNGAVPLKVATLFIFNRCHFKIIPLDNNDLKISVIDGIEYESSFRKEKINSFIIDLATGTVIIDLGAEHQIVSRNLKP